MTDERDAPDPKMVALIADAVARQLGNVGAREPVDKPPTVTGIDASIIKRTVALAIDDELSRRRVLSDTEIRVIAKEVAQTVVDGSTRTFLTEKQIENVIIEVLRRVGIRADDSHIDDTRQVIEAIIRSHKRRGEVSTDILKETLKALATLAIGGLVTAVITYLTIKGGGH